MSDLGSVRVPFPPLGLEVVWDGTTIRFEGDEVDEEAEMALAAFSADPSGIARFMLGVRDAERAGRLPDGITLTRVVTEVLAVLDFSFQWPREWGPVDEKQFRSQAREALASLVRESSVGAKMILARSSRGDVRAALREDGQTRPRRTG